MEKNRYELSNSKMTKAYGWLSFCIWLLIALGGSVRAMNAGLACPDWPLCFGEFIPDYHPQVYFEFIHRVFAGGVSVVAVLLACLGFRKKVFKTYQRWIVIFSLILLATQVVFGGLTVILKLQEMVVTTHLFLGTLFFLLNLFIYLDLKGRPKPSPLRVSFLYIYFLFIFAMIYLQVLLGGLVASHMAARLCTDFPKCNGEWIPTLSGTLGLHVWHRLVAYGVALLILSLFILAKIFKENKIFQSATRQLVYIVLMQVALGVINVLAHTPPLITVLHLANAVVLLGWSLQMARAWWPTAKGEYQVGGMDQPV